MPRKSDLSDEVFEKGSGRKEGQKRKPYLVMRFLLKETDGNHAVPAKEIVAYLQADCGINAERGRTCREDFYAWSEKAREEKKKCDLGEISQDKFYAWPNKD